MKRLLTLCTVAALACAGATASAASVVPQTGKWSGFENKTATDGLSFRLSERGSKYRVSSIRLKTDAQCINPDDPSGPLAVRRLYLKLAPGTIGRGQGFSTRGSRKTGQGTRRQTVRLRVRFTSATTATARIRVADDVVSGTKLRCRSTFRVKPKLRR